MRGRVEKISPIRGVSFDVTHSFEERRGYSGGGEGRRFHDMLRQAMESHQPIFSSAPQDAYPSEPYALDVTRATHSLFYEDDSISERIGTILHEE